MKWFNENQSEVSFFVAGWCALACLTNLTEGSYVWAAFNGALVYFNIKLAK